MLGVSGVLVVTVTLVSTVTLFALQAAGASSARHSLRPLSGERNEIDKTSRETCVEIAKSCPAVKSSQLSSPAKAGDPVRRGFSAQSLTSLEYWFTRLRG